MQWAHLSPIPTEVDLAQELARIGIFCSRL